MFDASLQGYALHAAELELALVEWACHLWERGQLQPCNSTDQRRAPVLTTQNAEDAGDFKPSQNFALQCRPPPAEPP